MKTRIAILLTVLLLLMAVIPVYADTVIDYVLYTDIRTYIDGVEITSYNIKGNTAVVVEDLANYGFDVAWDGNARTLKVVRNTSKAISGSEVETTSGGKVGDRAMPVYATDIKTYLDGKETESYNVGGRTIVYVDDLAALYASDYKWDSVAKTLSVALSGSVKIVTTKSSSGTKITATSVVAKAEYDEIGVTSEGYTAVCKDGMWGFIDENGNVAVELKYGYATRVMHGYGFVIDDYSEEYGKGFLSLINMKTGEVKDAGLAYWEDWYGLDKNGAHNSLWVDKDAVDGIIYGNNEFRLGGSKFLYDAELGAFNHMKGIFVVGGTSLRPDGITEDTSETYERWDETLKKNVTGVIYKTNGYNYAWQTAPEVNGVIPMQAYMTGNKETRVENAMVPRAFFIDLEGNITRTFDVNLKAYTYADENGNYTDPGEYSILQVTAPENGISVVAIGYVVYTPDGRDWNNVWTAIGLIDTNGKWAMEPNNDLQTYFYKLTGNVAINGYYRFGNDKDGVSVYDNKGNKVLKNNYDRVIINGEFIYVEHEDNAYIIDFNETTVDIEKLNKNDEIEDISADGKLMLFSTQNEETYLVAYDENTNKFVIVDGSKELHLTSIKPDGVFTYTENGKYGLYNITLG